MTWIKIEDKWPPVLKYILFTDGNKVYKGWMEHYEGPKIATFYNDTSSDLADYFPDNVTHWVELPKIPQEKND
jgi:uncharacterized protein DUF551